MADACRGSRRTGPRPRVRDGRYISRDTWYDPNGKPFQPQVHYYVGGATKLYGAALYRLRPQDFGELKHVDGVSPAWPIEYGDMEPYYTMAEGHYRVRGARGEDPTEPPTSAPYPFPALPHEPRIQQLSDDLAAEGLHPFHAPCGVLRDEDTPQTSVCVRCGFCDGFPCPLHAKSDAEVMGVRPALGSPNVTLLTDARAVRLDTNPDGTAVTDVVIERDGSTETLTGDVVVVSCGAANSAKLLLASANDQHPNGLANASDQVGRNYMYHNSKAVVALSKEANDTVFQKTLGVNDFYFGMPDLRVPDGQHPDGRQVEGPHVPWREADRDQAGARIQPGRDRQARHRLLAVDGGPAPPGQPGDAGRDGSITLTYTTNDEPKKRLYHTLKSMLGHLGMHPDHLLPRTTT